MTPELPDLPVAERYVAPALTYGTHDRTAPFLERILRACWRAAKPALIVTCIATALAYALAPHEYTAVAIVSAEQDVVSLARGQGTSPKMLAARADALAQSLKQTDYLRKVLETPEWRAALAERPGPTKFAPIEGERIAGTNRVRIRFTDDTAERARAGAEAAVAALQPIDGQSAKDAADVVERTLGSLVAREKQFNEQVEAMKAQEAADLATVANTPATISPAGSANRALALRLGRSPSSALSRQLAQATSARWRAENELANAPRVQRVSAATTPRIASNQRELLSTAGAVAGAVFPLAFIVALYHSWRYGRTATTQVIAADRYMTVADIATLVLPSRVRRRRFGAMLLPSIGFAAAVALIAGGSAYSLAPRRYSATATLSAPSAFFAPVQAAPGISSSRRATSTVSPAEVYAALRDAANSGAALRQVVDSPQWKLVRGADPDTADRLLSGASVEVRDDAQGVSVTFTDVEPEAARFGAEAVMAAARDVVAPPPPRGPWATASLRHGRDGPRGDAMYSVVRQLPAATVAGSEWPSNTREIATTAATRAAQAFGAAFVLAIACLYLRASRVAAKRAQHRGTLPFRSTLGRTAAAAACVGLVAYAVVPRTYSATATLRVQAGETDGTPAPMPVVTRIGEAAADIAHSAVVKTFPGRAEIEITYSAPDPHVAAATANRLATLVATTWRDRMWGRLPLDASKSFADAEAVRRWSEASRTVRLDAASLAKLPRWARQAEPLQTASLAAMAAFAFVLSVVTLHRRGARLSSDGARHPGLDFDALDDEETLLLHAGK